MESPFVVDGRVVPPGDYLHPAGPQQPAPWLPERRRRAIKERPGKGARREEG